MEEPIKKKPMNKITVNRICILVMSIWICLLGIGLTRQNELTTDLSHQLDLQATTLTEIITDLDRVSYSLHKDITLTRKGFQGVGTVLSNILQNTSLHFPYVIDQALPAVVSVTRIDLPHDRSWGAGYVHDAEKGYIVTAKHIVEELTTDDCIVVLHGGYRVPAEDIYVDPNEDIAVIVVDVNDPNYCPEEQLILAESDILKRGELVLSIGSPFSRKDSVSAGIISNPEGNHINFGHPLYEDEVGRIQYDAASNPGNSGGPVINMQGQVIGICVSGIGCRDNADAGVNFAVPAKSILECLERFEQWLGRRVIEDGSNK